ncbi:AraC family transcriptional regulator [Paenibacillus selenitireducens]|uniref:AraC family transcriptional regulator n=1 Tax=Paenibacillus selenitireducens TaxID=1324314 RepID=A0A1T2XHT1_9BACL|nr:helix-turn-helix domain-containing protein [Paenibacillus selenitireducens]OPA79352.1 AraC family transcriptional regulator [Paenibacillus selenitireducens]
MNRDYFKSKLFLKFIGSYLFILLIPLILATVFIYRNAVSNLQSEIEQSHLNQLTQTKTVIDGRIKELNDIASRISYDERLTPFRVHDPYDSRDSILALNNYKATSSIIGELFLYYHNDPKIYSTQGMSDLHVFEANYGFQNWRHEDLVKELNTAKYPSMRPADIVVRNGYREQSMLAYNVPITPNSPNPHGSVMYLINESEIAGLIESVLGNYRGLTYIFDNNGNILTHSGNGESLTMQEAKSLFTLAPGIHNQKINGESHSVVSVKSDKNGWSYVTLMTSDQFFSSVLHVRSFIIILFFIIVLVGAAIALVLARRQYSPIFELVNFANAQSGTDRSSGNELDRIRTTLQDYSSRVDLQEPYARNHFLSLLLKYGNTQSLTPDLLEAFDLQFDQSHHFVMVIGWTEAEDQQGDLQDRQEIIQMHAQIEFPELAAHAYGVELPQLDQLALIVSFNLGDDMLEFSHVRQIVEATRNNLLEMFDVIPMIGVGTCYSSLDQLNQSFIEAYSAYEMRMSTGQGTVTFFEKLSHSQDQTVWIDNSVLLKLSQSLKQGNDDVAEQMIHIAIRDLQTSELSSLLMRCVCFDILNTMLKTASELGIQNVLQEVGPNIMSGSLDELERNFFILASRICAQVERNHKKEEHSLMDQIVNYIDTHYMDHTLSLETISFEFTISPSHLSRSFKEKVGINFIQYIWQKRVEAVMHDLKTTNDPLKDIIMRVGYLDTPNFIRKFKKETGYTPGQYRQMHSQTENPETTLNVD